MKIKQEEEAVEMIKLSLEEYTELIMYKERAEQQTKLAEEYKQRLEKYETILFAPVYEENGSEVPKTVILSRKCSACKVVKFTNEFYRDRTQSGGFSYKCIECTKNTVKKRKVSASTPSNE